MSLNTNELYQAYPQLSKIPHSILVHHFEIFNLPKHILSIMTADDKDIEDQIERNRQLIKNQTNFRYDGKYQVWLAIAFSREEMSHLRLLAIARCLALNEQDMFFLATVFGNLSYLNFLVAQFPSADVRKNIQADSFKVFWSASRLGHVGIMQRLIELASDDQQNMIEAEDFAAFTMATGNGHLSVIEFFVQINSQHVSKMIKANHFKAFRCAAQSGELPALERLIELAPGEVKNMIKAENFEAFRFAALRGELPLLERLIQLAPDDVPNMIKAKNFEAFRFAARRGELPLLERLIQLAPGEVQNMIKAENFNAFRLAACRGKLPLLERLIHLAPGEVQNMIKAENFEAFRFAACNGLLPVIERLIQLAPGEVQNMIKARHFDALMSATEKGHLAVIKKLIELYPPNDVENMIEHQNYEVFKKAAYNEKLEIIDFFITKLSPAKVQDMIKANNFKVFRAAATGRSPAIIIRLIELAPTETQNMIQAGEFEAFNMAVKFDRIPIMERLLQLVKPVKINQMMISQNYAALRSACQSSRMDTFRQASLIILERLLSHYSVLDYAEKHVQEFRDVVNPFVDKKLRLLRVEKSDWERQNPNAVFDINNRNETKLLFYVLRRLIRRNEEGVQADILFLLNIPSVKSSAHLKNNELLQLALAMSRNNREAINLLLNIPAVHQLAEQHHFYSAEARGMLDLRQLAQNRESSMIALSKGEQNRLARAFKHYKPMLDATGEAQIMTNLREILSARYEANPAMFDHRGTTCLLPLQWSAFQALKLDQGAQIAAMEAYAKHKDHSAWRYLLKPNHWMHPEAAFVNVNIDTLEKWSSFEAFQPLICLCYLAAIDREIEATEGYTVEARLDGLIDELALINRAHNWDNKRFKTNAQGMQLFDNDHNPIMEEFDNGEGDKPSCPSGVKRRLLQAVKGHPLFTILTADIINDEIRTFVLEHFRRSLNPANRNAINVAWNKLVLCDKLTQEDINVLKVLNISEQEKKQFIAHLTHKYQEQFAQDTGFLHQINTKFSLQENDSHVQKFGHIFAQIIKDNRPHSPHSEMGFFEPNPSAQDEGQTRVQKKVKFEP